jgi:hypothetical protein
MGECIPARCRRKRGVYSAVEPPKGYVSIVADWISPFDELPYRAEIVFVRVHGRVRPAYYRIHDRWYAMIDIDRWQMNTSPYWDEDRAWYLRTDEIEAWRPAKTLSDED